MVYNPDEIDKDDELKNKDANDSYTSSTGSENPTEVDRSMFFSDSQNNGENYLDSSFSSDDSSDSYGKAEEKAEEKTVITGEILKSLAKENKVEGNVLDSDIQYKEEKNDFEGISGENSFSEDPSIASSSITGSNASQAADSSTNSSADFTNSDYSNASDNLPSFTPSFSTSDSASDYSDIASDTIVGHESDKKAAETPANSTNAEIFEHKTFANKNRSQITSFEEKESRTSLTNRADEQKTKRMKKEAKAEAKKHKKSLKAEKKAEKAAKAEKTVNVSADISKVPKAKDSIRGSVRVKMPAENIIACTRNVVKEYGTKTNKVRALDDVSVDIKKGEFTAIMGPSGSGKSTFMHCMSGLDSIDSGQLVIDGYQINNMSEKKLTTFRRDHIGFVFQKYNLVQTLTAKENILLPLTIAHKKIDKQWYEEVVELVGLRDRLTHRPSELSGGQQQRVALARALVSKPSIVFADEPTGNLDSKASNIILQFFREYVDRLNQTIVIVTHDPSITKFADRVLMLVDGKFVKNFENPKADEIAKWLLLDQEETVEIEK